MIFVALVGMTLMAEGSTPLVGTVVAENGTPIVGAEIVLTGPKPGESPVVARGKSGEGGRFRIDRPASLAPTNRYLVPTLWTAASGHRVSVQKFSDTVPDADHPVRVVLRSAARTEVRVASPEGEPVTGARISVQRIKSEALPVPDPIADFTERKTGPDGVAILDAFGPDDVSWVDVIADRYGIQPRWLDPETPGPKRVELRPVVTVKGQLVLKNGDPSLAQGWRIRAWTREPQTDPRTVTVGGYAATSTDDQGRFTLSELVPGTLSLTVTPPGSSEFLPDLTNLPPIRAGRENRLEIALRMSAFVTGLVRERETGKPVAGMSVTLFPPGMHSGIQEKTNAEGRYTFRSLAGKARVWAPESPRGYVSEPGAFSRDLEVPAEGRARVEVEPFLLTKAAPPVHGEVRDAAGRSVAGARVTAQWTTSTSRGPVGGSTAATTDASGAFSLEGLAPRAHLNISVRSQDHATAKPVAFDVGSDRPLVVTIVPHPVVAIAGRVLGPGGAPIAGALITIHSRQTEKNQPHFGMPVNLLGSSRIRTAADGTFKTPKELDRNERDYQVEVSLAGYHLARTAWATPGEGDVLTLPDLTLSRAQVLRVVAGRVLDREKHPVAGALVFQAGDGPARTEVTADKDGRFRLSGVYAGPALVFAEKTGFRFGGAIVGPEVQAPTVEIVLARENEPPLERFTTRPAPMSRAEERALGLTLLEPVLKQARAGTMSYAGERVLPALARLDPARVLTMIENRVVAQSAPILHLVALAQAENDPRAAVATIEADQDPVSRAQGLLDLADASREADRARHAELLDRALAETRPVESPEQKLSLLGEIAKRWIDAGDLARATPILREGEAVIPTLPKDRFTYQVDSFAEVLAAIDLPAARAIWEGKSVKRFGPLDDATLKRHLGEAAVRIAAANPEEAERLAGDLGGPNIGNRASLLLTIARRMGRIDLPRARRVLALIVERADSPALARPALIPYGLGLIACDRAATDRASARALLDEAFAGLLQIARGKERGSYPPVSILMAMLLPGVERADPDRVAERLWLAVSCRPPRPQDPNVGEVSQIASLALLTAQYDPSMAQAITAPALKRLPSLFDRTDGSGYFNDQVFGVLAAYDPRAVESLIQALPAAARRTERTTDGNISVAPELLARLQAAEKLGLPIEARRHAALKLAAYPATDLP